MNTSPTARLLLLGLALLGALAGCASPPFPSLGATAEAGEERRILVTFQDGSIARDLPANPQDRYRPRGAYANSSWSARIARALAERHRLRLIAEWPVTALGVVCVVYEVPPERPLAGALRGVAADPEVESVQPMHAYKVLGTPESSAEPYSDPYFRLQRELRAMHVAEAHRLATGRGVRIAIIDSGVDTGHPDLARQIAASENLAVREPGEPTADLHGTAVAGVIAARSGNGIGIVGIAPDAELYAFRACWPERPGAAAALCNSFTLALAVNEAIRHAVHIINFSLTGPADPLVERLIRAALAQGILVVAAVPAEVSAADGFPANLADVTAVRAAGSGPASHPDTLAAPGSGILTTVPHASYDFMSGSSFAAPHVTGLLALMREVRPNLAGAEAREILRALAAPISPAPPTESRTVDACLALARLRGRTDCSLPIR